MSGQSIQFNIQAVGSQQVVNDINKIFDALSKATKQQQELQRQLATLTNRSKGNSSDRADLINQITGDPTKSREALKRIRAELKATEKAMADLGRQASSVSIIPPAGRVSNFAREINQLRNAYLNLTKEQRASPVGQNILNQIRTQSKELRDTLKEIKAATGEANEGGGLFGSFGSTLANVFKFQVASQIIQTFVQTVGYAEETVRAFDAEMTNLGSLLGSVADTALPRLESEALRLGRTTAFTALEVVQLQQNLVKLGFSAGSVVAMTGAIINFSVAVRESADRVALLTGATLKAFNLSALETTRVVDVLTRATLRTALNFSYLETALPTVASAAEEAGVSFEDLVGNIEGVEGTNTALETTVAVLGVLADRGVKASTAATSFRNILIESSKRGLTFVEALERMSTSTNVLATAFNLFGKRGAVQALILAKNLDEIKTRTEELIKGVDNLGNRLASAESVAAIQLTSIQGHVTLLKSAWDGFLLSVGNTKAYKKVAKGFLSATTEMLEGISALIDGEVSLRELLKNDPDNLFDDKGNLKRKRIFEDGIKIVRARRAIEGETRKIIEDQARLGLGIFNKSKDTLVTKTAERNLIKQVTIEYEKTGIKVGAQAKAQTLVNGLIQEANDLLAQQAERQAALRTLLSSYTDSYINQIGVLEDARTVVSQLQEALNFTDQVKEPKVFTNYLRLLRVAEERVKALDYSTKEGTASARAQESALEALHKRLAALYKQLEAEQDGEARLNILGDIEKTKEDIRVYEKSYTDFITFLNKTSLTLLDRKGKDIFLQELDKRLLAEKTIDEQRARNRISSEKGLATELERINVDYEVRRLNGVKDTTEKTDIEYSKLVKSIAEKNAELIKLTFKVELDTANSGIDLTLANSILEITRKTILEKDKELDIKQAEAIADRDKLILLQKELEFKQQLALLSQILTGASQQLTEEEQAQLATIKAQVIERNKQISDRNISVGFGLEGKLNDNEKAAADARIQALQDYIEGKITDQEFKDSIGIEIETYTAQDQLTDILDTINLERVEADAKALFDMLSAQAETEIVTEEHYARLAAAEEAYLIAKQNSIDKANVIKTKKQGKTDAEDARRIERLARQLASIASDFGENIVEGLIDEDSMKDKMKSIMKSIVDLVTNSLVITLTQKLVTAIGSLPATLGEVTRLVATIAGVKAAGAAGKALIDRLEYGGMVKGPAHVNGGVKMYNRAKGGYDELEGGEFVMNKHATAANLPLLEQLNKKRNHYGALGQIRSKRVFQEGGLNAPQLLSTTNNNISTILDDSQLNKQAEIMAARLTEGLLRVIGQNNKELMGVVVDGLNKRNQRDIIELHAYKKSRI